MICLGNTPETTQNKYSAPGGMTQASPTFSSIYRLPPATGHVTTQAGQRARTVTPLLPPAAAVLFQPPPLSRCDDVHVASRRRPGGFTLRQVEHLVGPWPLMETRVPGG